MAGDSDLADLYEAVFGTAPSATSRVTMRRMEDFLKLKRGDPFSRMLIVQLRCADQMEETRLQQQSAVETVVRMLEGANRLSRELDRAWGDVARRNRGIPEMTRATDLVHAGRPSSPLISYFASGLRPRGRFDDVQASERRSAARFDLFLLACLFVLAVMLGAGLHKAGVTLL